MQVPGYTSLSEELIILCLRHALNDFLKLYLFNDKNFIYKNQKKIITKSKPKRIMKNTKEIVLYDNSVAKSYRNSEFFKILLVGSLSFVAWKGILLGGQQMVTYGSK